MGTPPAEAEARDGPGPDQGAVPVGGAPEVPGGWEAPARGGRGDGGGAAGGGGHPLGRGTRRSRRAPGAAGGRRRPSGVRRRARAGPALVGDEGGGPAARRDSLIGGVDNPPARPVLRPLVITKNAAGARSDDAAPLPAPGGWAVTTTLDVPGEPRPLSPPLSPPAGGAAAGRRAGSRRVPLLLWRSRTSARGGSAAPSDNQTGKGTETASPERATPPAGMPDHGTSEYLPAKRPEYVPFFIQAIVGRRPAVADISGDLAPARRPVKRVLPECVPFDEPVGLVRLSAQWVPGASTLPGGGEYRQMTM